jgi:type IV pilus assembly protein PilA
MKKEMNNKGFSLVELIIVIAIMAILIVVLAPQYLKYVEKSRNSTDVSNATEIVTALQVYASDPDAKVALPASGTITINITSTGGAATDAFSKAALLEAGLADSSGNISSTCVSRSNWTSYTITGTIANGNITFTYSADGADGANTAFSNLMTGKTSS